MGSGAGAAKMDRTPADSAERAGASAREESEDTDLTLRRTAGEADLGAIQFLRLLIDR